MQVDTEKIKLVSQHTKKGQEIRSAWHKVPLCPMFNKTPFISSNIFEGMCEDWNRNVMLAKKDSTKWLILHTHKGKTLGAQKYEQDYSLSSGCKDLH